MECDFKDLGALLKQMRKERKLTLDELAEAVDVDPGTIGKWERKEYKGCKIDTAVKICEFLKYKVLISVKRKEE